MTRVWTASGNLNKSRTGPAGAGSSRDAALCFGGTAAGASNVPETFNGVSWSVAAGTNMTARTYPGGCGTQSAALCVGGWEAANRYLTETYDGTTWSAGGNVPFGSTSYSHIACGTPTNALTHTRTSAATYNGAAWTFVGVYSGVDRNLHAGYGTPGAAIVVGVGLTTELWNGVAWSYGGNIIQVRYGLAGCGTTTTGLIFGGSSTGAVGAATEECNGTTWSTSSNLNTPVFGNGGVGSQSTALSFYNTTSETYDTQVLAAPVADFSGTPTSGLAPLTVVFTDLSTNTPTTWDWDWGDGATHGTTQNPTHIFTIPGTFTVTLIATNAYGTDTEAKVAYIGVSGTAGAVAVGDKVLIANVKGVPVIVRQ